MPSAARTSSRSTPAALSAVLPQDASGIPAPQRDALEVALLLRPAGEAVPPSARAIGLAVCPRCRAALAAGPVVVAVDDAQWLDRRAWTRRSRPAC